MTDTIVVRPTYTVRIGAVVVTGLTWEQAIALIAGGAR